MRTLAISLFHTLSLLAFAAGLGELFMAVILPRGYVLKDASAIQITQVYSEATYTALIAIALLVGGVFIQILLHGKSTRKHQRLLEEQFDQLIELQAE